MESLHTDPGAQELRRLVGELSPVFRVAGWRVDRSLHRISRNGSDVGLEPKVLEVLVVLAAARGEVVTREALLDTVWEGRYVGGDVLTRAVSELRKVLDRDAAGDSAIETIRQRGYRLLAPVEAVPAPVPAPSPVPASERRVGAVAGAALLLLALFAIVGITGRRTASRDADRPAAPPAMPVASSPMVERDPALSPDGTRVALARVEERGTALHVHVPETGRATRLTDGSFEDRLPTWSPDGTRLAFVRFGEGAPAVHVTSATGGTPRLVTDYPLEHEAGLAWSPDGSSLVLPCPSAGDGAPVALCRHHLETGERRELTSPPAGIRGDHTPAVSPDGRSIAFLRTLYPGVDDLYLVRAEGGEARRLTADHADVTGHGWLPDGSGLVISSSRAGLYSLWRVPVDGGSPVWVAGGSSKLKHPSVARDEPLVAYEEWSFSIGLWLAPTGAAGDGASPEELRVAPSTQWDHDPAPSPDGTRVAFVSNRSGSTEVWAAPLAGGPAERLTSFGGGAPAMPRWSPDGQELVFVGRPEGEADLYTLRPDHLSPRRLTRLPGDELAPSWTPDGRSVLFASRHSGDWEVWRVAAAGGEPVQVTTRGGFRALATAERGLFYTRPDRPGIWQHREDGEPRRVVADLEPRDGSSWGPTEAGLVYVARGEGGPVLRLQPWAGPARTLRPLSETFVSAAPLADGERILIARTDEPHCDVVLLRGVPGLG